MKDEVSIPFDEFERPGGGAPGARRGPLARWTEAGLRCISFAALWVAILTVALVLLGHTLPMIAGPQWIGARWLIHVKSGIPLVAIGISYFALVLTLRRTPGQLLVGVLMGLAFALWGAEQFLEDRALVPFIDDCVVFLFVVDLSIVIRHNFRESAAERRGSKSGSPGGRRA